jgi:tRNA A-37 threonylcarbamoyl transferase component Bud32
VPVLDARYELGHRIGGGGMAEVVEAYDRKLDRRVAVKLLHVGVADPRARERFMREARMAAGFVHPNVVTIYDVGEVRGRPYLVMELVEGGTLGDLIARDGPLPVGQALAISDSVLAGLGAAHADGLVHRDVKPANILIGTDGRVKLADFGIAKATQDLGRDLTATGQVLGTAGYLAPEQAAGGEATPASDVYAAGVVLYEMLAGQPPFTGEHPVAVAVAHQRAKVPPLGDKRPGLPPGVLSVVSRSLEKDPSRRFRDASQMRTELAAVGGPGAAQTIGAGAAGAATLGAGGVTLPLAASPGPTALRPADADTPSNGGRRPGREKNGRSRPPRRGVVIAGLVGAAVGATALGTILLTGGGGSDPTLGAARVTTTSTLPPTTTTTLPPTTTTTLPQTVSELVALLAADPSAFGEKGQDLFNRLITLSQQPDRQGRDAARLISDLQSWLEEGKISPTIGALAVQIVTPLATFDNSSGKSGKGGRDFGGGFGSN